MNKVCRPWLLELALVAIAVPLAAMACADDSSGSLIVYSGRSESLVGPIIKQFTQTSGLNVFVNYGSTGEMAATLQEEGRRSQADVFFAQDPGGIEAVASMLATLDRDLLDIVPPWAHSRESKWVGITGRVRTVVYNTHRLSEEDLPISMSGFTDPVWNRRIGWAPTNSSFHTMVTAMRSLWGEERTVEWLNGIQANHPRQYPKNTPIVAAVANGEVDVGFVNHYYLYRFIQEEGEDFPARNFYTLGDGPGSLVLVASLGILETSGNKKNAESFVRFMLSDVAQRYFVEKTYEYPLADGILAHQLLPHLPKVRNNVADMASLADIKGTQALLRDLGIIP